MRPKTTFIIVAIALGLSSINLAIWIYKNSQSQLIISSKQRLFAGIHSSQVERIEIFHNLNDLANFYKDKSGVWHVSINRLGLEQNDASLDSSANKTTQIDDLANNDTIASLSAIIDLARNSPTELTPEQAGIQTNIGYLLSITAANADPVGVYLGAVSEDNQNRYLTLTSNPDLVQAVPADFFSFLSVASPVDDWRTRDIFSRDELTTPTAISLTSPNGQTTKFELSPDGWYMTSPFRWRAESQALEQLLRRLQSLRARRNLDQETDPGFDPNVSQKLEQLAQLGLNNNSPHITINYIGEGKPQTNDINTQSATVQFGNRLQSGEVYAYRPGRPDAVIVDTALFNELEQLDHPGASDNYLDRRLQLWTNISIPAVKLTLWPGRNEMNFTPETNGDWQITGIRNFTGNKQICQTLIDVLRNLRAATFYNKDLGEEKLIRTWEILHPGDKRSLGQIQLSVNLDNHLIATIPGLPVKIGLDQMTSGVLLAPPAQFRTPEFWHLEMDKIEKITVKIPSTGANVPDLIYQRRGNSWIRTDDEPNAIVFPIQEDIMAYERLVLRLANLTALACLSDEIGDLSSYGLDKPITIVINVAKEKNLAAGSDFATYTLLVGSQQKMTEHDRQRGRLRTPHYAKVTDDATVFLLDGTLVNDLIQAYN